MGTDFCSASSLSRPVHHNVMVKWGQICARRALRENQFTIILWWIGDVWNLFTVRWRWFRNRCKQYCELARKVLQFTLKSWGTGDIWKLSGAGSHPRSLESERWGRGIWLVAQVLIFPIVCLLVRYSTFVFHGDFGFQILDPALKPLTPDSVFEMLRVNSQDGRIYCSIMVNWEFAVLTASSCGGGTHHCIMVNWRSLKSI